MKRIITFKANGYDPFVDYLKGVCILWVVLTHAFNSEIHDYSLFCLWGDLAVPIFLLIQCIHIYKKDSMPPLIKWRKIWNRILKPFIYIELIIFVVGLLAYYVSRKPIIDFIYNFLCQGGIGRGSYYPKMYIEFALLIPLFYPILRLNSKVGGGILLTLSIIIELAFSYFDYYILWQWICFRYLFILYFGYIIAKSGILMNRRVIIFSAVSLIAILFFQYSGKNMEPLFYDNDWKIYHWPIYFYVAYMLLYLLFLVYRHTNNLILNVVLLMGKYSYEIFLFQMLVFFVTDMTIRTYAFSHGIVISLLYILFVIFLSIFPILIYKHYSGELKDKLSI